MNEPNAYRVLREWAHRHKRNVSDCQVFDKNVCSWQIRKDRPWEFITTHGQPLSFCVRFKYRHGNGKALANHEYLMLHFDTELQFDPLDVNRPDGNKDPLPVFTTETKFGDRRFPIFTPSGEVSAAQRDLLKSAHLVKLIRSLDLSERDSVHFARGALSLYCLAELRVDLDEIIDTAAELLDQVEVVRSEPEARELPGTFRPLTCLIEKWGVADDDDRSSLIENADRAELKTLVAKVEPFFDSINIYLDSFGDKALDDGAMALGRLAEAAQEAKIFLSGELD